MITLNNINLSSIDLSGIDLRGIKLGLGGRGSGSGDGFPQLLGDVTRWHFGGLTNAMMAAMDDPRLEDADGKGRFLSFKNFAWSGMSGAGGYNQNFNQWGYGNLPPALQTYTPHKMELNIPSTLRTGNVYSNLGKEGDIYDFTLNIVGLKDGASLDITKGVVSGNIERIKKDGIYKIYQPLETSWDQLRIYIVIHNPNLVDLNITIEQLPLYPGFILGDGVDDFAVTEKELNFEDTYTVYMAFIPFQVDPVRAMEICGKDFKKDFYLYYSNTHVVYYTSGLNNYIPVRINQFHIIVCKRNKTNAVIKNLITGESKTFSVSELIDNPGVYYLWRYQRSGTSTAKTAIAGQTICNGYFSTDEDDEKILDWYKKQYPWLFPDQAWTVVGKTNEDEDRATIANITGNGNDLVLSNFGFAEGSGYNEEGEYAGYLVTDGVDDKIVSSESIAFTDTWTIITDAIFLGEKIVSAGILVKDIFDVRNLMEYGRVEVSVKGGVLLKVPTPSIKAICSDGRIYDADWNEYQAEPGTIKVSEGKLYIGMWYNGMQFCSIAFKNLAIYPTVLSKEDCIKAYNYLQTLKAK